MLNVTFYRDSRNRLSSFFADGHAQFAVEAEDVVCAAVSGILQAARLGLMAHAHVDVNVFQEKGEMRLRVPEDRRDDAAVQAIVATAELATEQIARQYPEYVRCHRESEPVTRDA